MVRCCILWTLPYWQSVKPTVLHRSTRGQLAVQLRFAARRFPKPIHGREGKNEKLTLRPRAAAFHGVHGRRVKNKDVD